MWRNDTPPTNTVVEVWFWTEIRRARFDGARWRDAYTDTVLYNVIWWRGVR